MRIQSDLCHIDDHRAVVKVFAWNEEQPLGSALGEGKTAEIAEERAINRLFSRTKQKLNQQEYNQPMVSLTDHKTFCFHDLA